MSASTIPTSAGLDHNTWGFQSLDHNMWGYHVEHNTWGHNTWGFQGLEHNTWG
jgi:hypothetical protein